MAQKVSSALLQVWLVTHEVPSCVKPVLHRLQFLLEPSQLKQFSSHLRHTLWGRPGVSSGKKPSLQAGTHLQSWKRKFGAQ